MKSNIKYADLGRRKYFERLSALFTKNTKDNREEVRKNVDTCEGKTLSTICLMEGLPFRNGKDDKFI